MIPDFRFQINVQVFLGGKTWEDTKAAPTQQNTHLGQRSWGDVRDPQNKSRGVVGVCVHGDRRLGIMQHVHWGRWWASRNATTERGHQKHLPPPPPPLLRQRPSKRASERARERERKTHLGCDRGMAKEGRGQRTAEHATNIREKFSRGGVQNQT